MNRITSYIDSVFAKYKQTHETIEFHEELIANCKERYDYAINSGLTEEEAEEKVMNNLGDVEGVLKEMTSVNNRYSADWKDSLKLLLNDLEQEMTHLGQRMNQHYQQAYDRTETKQYFPVVENLGIHVKSTDVSIIETDSENISVSSDEDTLTFENTSDSLIIREQNHSFGDEIVVGVPKGVRVLKIVTKNGDIDVDHDAIQKCFIETSSGDLEIHMNHANDVQLRTSSGDIECRLQGDAASLQISTTSGDIEAELDGFVNTNIQTTSGDVRLEVNDSAYDAMRIATTSGDVDFIAKHLSEINLQVSTVSGDVDRVPFSIGTDNPTIITTVSGDIEFDH